MGAKIGLLSDIHATAAPLLEALTILAREGADLVLCAGDIAGYGTELEQCVELLAGWGCAVIQGNHDLWHCADRNKGKEGQAETYLRHLPATWESTIEGKRVSAVHASPPYSMTRGIALLDQDGVIQPTVKELWAEELVGYGFDVLIVGHTHQVFAEPLGQTLVINPGSTKFNRSCAIVSLPDLVVRIIPLSGKMTRIWHWGMMVRAGVGT